MLVFFKIIFLIAIFILALMIGNILGSKYSNRLNELQEYVISLELLESRINYTYDTIPEIFEFISKNLKTRIKKIFEYSAEKMNTDKNYSAGEIYNSVIDEEKILFDLNNKDIEIIKGLSISLGQVDKENQVKNIRMILKNLLNQLEEAKKEKDKNYKLCRNMGAILGITVIIILI